MSHLSLTSESGLLRRTLQLIFLLLSYLISRALIQAYATPLRDVPGPWLAKFSRVWQLKAVHARTFQKTNLDLHRRYGSIVRIGPNEYSIDDPEAAKMIYRQRDQLMKSPRYSGWGSPGQEQNLFAERDIETHAGRRRQIAGLYHVSALAPLEGRVDECTSLLFERMNAFVDSYEVFELNQWLHYYAFDVIGEIALGKAFGFLGKGSDISGIMPAIHEFARYGAVIGVLHEWHPMIFRLLQMIAPSGSQGLAYIAQFTAQAIAECSQRATPHDTHGNLLSSMYAMHQKDPEAFKLQDIHYHSIPNIAAGSDTTATTLSAVLYFLCKVPRTLDVLRCELDERRKKGQFSELITFKEAQGCPYLQAVLKETLRLHPGNGLPMPRVVPKGGMTLAGRFFPEALAKTIVRINSWVAHFNRDVFGLDADEFRPERWLEDPERSNMMDQYFLTFGRGPRTCIGKGVSLMELGKVIPDIVLRYNIELVHPEKEWTVYNDWFIRVQDINVRVTRRHT